jgi:hypothetical protein
MSRLDDAFREALRRQEPPDGFAERVMSRIQARPERVGVWAGLLAAFRRPRLRWATALAAAALVVGAVEYRNERERRAEGERAKEQVMLALRITGGKLRLVQARVQRIGYAPRER